MSIVIDYHCHVLPGMDDGSRSLRESLALLEMEAEQGINRVVATPHFYAQYHRPEEFLAKRKKAEDQLRAAIAERVGLPELWIGAEVGYFPGMSHSRLLPSLKIRGTRHILVELPQPPWPEEMYRELGEIYNYQGLTPVVAHIDRYISPFHTYGIPERLEKLPVLTQANASFFLNRRTRSMALNMLKKGRLHLLGSDCHNTATRPPKLGEALQVIRDSLGRGPMEQVACRKLETLTSEFPALSDCRW